VILIESAVPWKTSEFLMRQKKVSIRGQQRWISEDGTQIYEWDELHGEIEMYNRRGKVVSILNSDGSVSSKKIKAGRTIDV